MQNFSGGLFSRRMGAPVSQTNAAGGSVQYSWGSGGRCKPTSGVRKRTILAMYIKFASNNVPGKISVQKKCGTWSGRTIHTIVNPALCLWHDLLLRLNHKAER